MSRPPILSAPLLLLILASLLGPVGPSLAGPVTQDGPAEEDAPPVVPAVAPPLRVGAAPT